MDTRPYRTILGDACYPLAASAIRRFLRWSVARRHFDYEDAWQIVTLAWLKNQEQVKDEAESKKFWMIAYCSLIDAVRELGHVPSQQSRHYFLNEEIASTPEELAQYADGQSIDNQLDARRGLAEIASTLEKCSPRNVTIWKMGVFDGMSMSLIADHFGIKLPRVHQIRSQIDRVILQSPIGQASGQTYLPHEKNYQHDLSKPTTRSPWVSK